MWDWERVIIIKPSIHNIIITMVKVNNTIKVTVYN